MSSHDYYHDHDIAAVSEEDVGAGETGLEAAIAFLLHDPDRDDDDDDIIVHGDHSGDVDVDGDGDDSSVEGYKSVEQGLFDDEEPDASFDDEDGTMTSTSSPINRTLVSDLQAHLDNEDIADVILKGTDGRTVPAVRSILAMRSRFFKSLLFGNFQESRQAEVPLGYSSLVLRAVVEYCYTDEIKLTFENLSFEETARSMVGLVAAGNYFELGGLLSRAYRLSCLMMDEYPALACSVLDEAVSGEKGVHTGELSRVALGIIRLRAESALLPPDTYGPGVHSLGEEAMELVMADEKIQANELKLFYCLKKWAEHVPEGESAQTVGEHRRGVAQQLASRIDFAKVAPSDLAAIVAGSGLVPLELMCLAYKTQALQAERKGMKFDRMRTMEQNHIMNGRVIVQGAGLSVINGTYESTSRRFMQGYSRRGNLPGYGAGEFLLHTLTMHDDTKKWLLSFRFKGETILDLYSAPVLSDEILPPMQKWIACSNTHERLRRMASRSKSSRKKKSHHARFASGESENGGDPPPICIWLPDEPAQRLS